MKIQHVPLEFVNQTWPKIEQYIQVAIDQQEGQADYTLDQVRKSIPSRVISENRTKTVDDLVERLRSATEISIDNEQLKAIRLSGS